MLVNFKVTAIIVSGSQVGFALCRISAWLWLGLENVLVMEMWPYVQCYNQCHEKLLWKVFLWIEWPTGSGFLQAILVVRNDLKVFKFLRGHVCSYRSDQKSFCIGPSLSGFHCNQRSSCWRFLSGTFCDNWAFFMQRFSCFKRFH
jgi:hypothetical protein